MANLYITEYSRIAGDADGHNVQVGAEPGTDQVVSFTTTTQSAAFSTTTKMIRVYADAACHINFGASPTATTSNKKLAADAPEYFGVIGGQKVAAVTAA